MKYELRFVLRKLLQHFPILESMGDLSSTKGIIISDHLEIYDVRHMYPSGSLLTNSLESNKHYIKEDYPIGLVETFPQMLEHSRDIVDYCFRDCLATF